MSLSQQNSPEENNNQGGITRGQFNLLLTLTPIAAIAAQFFRGDTSVEAQNNLLNPAERILNSPDGQMLGRLVYEGETMSMRYEGVLANQNVNIHAGAPQWTNYFGGVHYEMLVRYGDPSSYNVPQGLVVAVYEPLANVIPPIGDSAEHQLNASTANLGRWFLVVGQDQQIQIPQGFNINIFGGCFRHPADPRIVVTNNTPGAILEIAYPENVIMTILGDGALSGTNLNTITPNFAPNRYSLDLSPHAWFPE